MLIRNSDKKCFHLFSFQRLNKYFLMPFFIPIICFSTKFFSETIKTDNGNKDIKDVSEENKYTFIFLYQIIQSICLVFGGLLYFASVYVSKTQRDSKITDLESSPTNAMKKLFTKTIVNEKKDIKKILIIILMPFFFIAYNIGIAFGVGYPQLEKRVYFLFFITLMNIFIFKKQIYRHQKLSLLITIIGIIPIYLSFGLFLDKKLYSFIYDIFLFIGSFCYSVYLILIKYLTLEKRMSVFLLLLYQGVFCIFYTIIIFIGLSLDKNNNLTYISNVFNCTDSNFICISHLYVNIICYFILNTILQTLIFLVVYIFSPELFAISDIWSPLFTLIALYIKIKEDNWIKIFLTVLGYLIIAVGAFIYNELIVCNFCKLNENTWKAIDEKAYNDIARKETKGSFALIDNYCIDDFESSKAEKSLEMDEQF